MIQLSNVHRAMQAIILIKFCLPTGVSSELFYDLSKCAIRALEALKCN